MANIIIANLDRKRELLIDDEIGQGKCTFHASQKKRISGHKIKEIDVRENGTDKFQ